MTKRSADQTYKENTTAIQTAIQHLQAGLKDHGQEQAKEPGDYGFAGDVSHVLELLKQAVNFIRNEEE